MQPAGNGDAGAVFIARGRTGKGSAWERGACDVEVLTVTPNPAVDASIWYRRQGELNMIVRERREAGGKGINVSRAVAAVGGGGEAILLAGEVGHDPFWGMVEGLTFPCTAATLGDGRVRTNYTLIEDATGAVQKFNDPGPAVDATEADALLELLESRLKIEPLVALCGSLPPGIPADFYARCVQLVQGQYGLRCALDTSGLPLVQGLEARPFLIKPNLEEARELLRSKGRNVPEAPEGIAWMLLEMGPRQVLLSLGAAGAVLATESGVWRAVGPEVRVRNTVGCGDVLLGVYLQASTRMPPEDALVVAVGAAGIAAGMEGTAEMGRPTLEQMRAGVRRGIGSGLGPEA